MGGINMKTRRRETVSPKRSKAPRTSSPRSSSASDLQKQLDQRTRELAKARKHLAEALQQQTATSEVLKVISRSTFDLQAVLNTLTESVARLCEADMAAITRQKGTVHYWATSYGLPPELSEYLKSIPLEPGRGSVVGRTQLEGKTVHVRDVLADPEYTALEFQRRAGFRTVLGVPLLREGSPIGVIVLLRSEVQPFTDKQIELVTTFADQAGIAIENVRLFDAEQPRPRGPASFRKRWSSRRRARRCYRSSRVRPASWSPYLAPSWPTRRASARPISEICFCATRTVFASQKRTTHRPDL